MASDKMRRNGIPSRRKKLSKPYGRVGALQPYREHARNTTFLTESDKDD